MRIVYRDHVHYIPVSPNLRNSGAFWGANGSDVGDTLAFAKDMKDQDSWSG